MTETLVLTRGWQSELSEVADAPMWRMRLTRRGRLVLTVVAMATLAIALVGFSFFRGSAAVAGDGAANTTVVVVGAGDTLWGIAQRIAPDRDPRAVIYEIEALNGLAGAVVVPGQAISVPS